jgi:drug/metabolite transporter (DMT)-like permease
MDRVIAVLTMVALVGSWYWFVHKKSNGRAWSPLWIAFSTTATAILFIVSGAIGYTLDKRTRSIAGSWSDTVIWWEVWVGIASAVIAIYFWHRGLRSLGTSN